VACALTLESVAGRLARTSCPRCSLPIQGADQVYAPKPEPVMISRRFAAEPRAGGAARRALEALLWNLEPAQLEVAALLTTELIANAIDHSRPGTCGSVRLEILLTGELLRVEVGDEGPGFVPAPRAADAGGSWPNPKRSSGLSSIRGLRPTWCTGLSQAARGRRRNGRVRPTRGWAGLGYALTISGLGARKS
jgi:anti-sigma regulatory factor (Ser/Thr protein kinase)